MSGCPADTNLLFGILAMQMDFIAREDLVTATSIWIEDKSRSLDQILLERNLIQQDEYDLLSALVKRVLAKHGNDAQKSLEAISSISASAEEELNGLADPDVSASLDHLGKNRDQDDAYRTQSFSIGDATSKGGRFRILRKHDEGGLGIVFVAFDEEVGREVALKEIKPKYADSQRRRERFMKEAEVTGALQHPGVVPVYGLGQYADGRPFYAMRFIRGDSLEEAAHRFHRSIPTEQTGSKDRSFRGSDFRQLLGRFIDVCNAISYAHERGVLHRDLKPQNIMLGKHGETLVVDWGLAKLAGRNEEGEIDDEPVVEVRSGSGGAPTESGQVIGTPEFMPPEQAAGKLDQLGPASDVYSLGATLYYVLTGHAPVEDVDAQRILRKVRNGEIPAPRSVNIKIPKALEAICLKAMAKSPKSRYSTPDQLVRDMEHWLADEPVAAYADTLLERFSRWMRHNRAWAVSASISMLVVAVVAVCAAAFMYAAKGKVEKALSAEAEALRDRTQAYEKMVATERKSQGYRRAANEILEDVMHETQRRLEGFQGAQYAQSHFFNDMLERSEEFLEQVAENGDEPSIDEKLVHALAVNYIAGVLEKCGTDPTRRAKGTAYENRCRSHEELVKLATQTDATEHLRAYRGLAASYCGHADALSKRGKIAEAERDCKEAEALLKELLHLYPQDDKTRELMPLPSSTLAGIYENCGQFEEACREYRQSLGLWEDLAQGNPSDLSVQEKLASHYYRLTRAMVSNGRSADASENAKQALVKCDMLLQHDNGNTKLLTLKSLILEQIGRIQRKKEDYDGALSSFTEFSEISVRLLESNPHSLQLEANVAASYLRLSETWMLKGNAKEAAKAARIAVARLSNVALKSPDSIRWRSDLGYAHHNLGEALAARATGDSKTLYEAIENYDKAASQFCDIIKDFSTSESVVQKALRDLRGLAMDCNSLGSKYVEHGEYQNAHALEFWALEKWRELYEQDESNSDGLAEALNRLAWVLATHPDSDSRDGDQAIEYATEACNLTHWQNAGWIDTLAASFAQAGQFWMATELERLAIAITESEGDRRAFEYCLKLYESGETYTPQPQIFPDDISRVP